MKTALCLSGLTRGLSYSWIFIEKFISQKLDADVFIHTWEDDHGGFSKKEKYFTAPSILDGRSKQNYFDEEIKPVDYCIESLGRNSYTNDSTSPMYYSINQSNALKKKNECKHNFIYDLVIRARMDLILETELSDKDIERAMKEDIILVSGACAKEEFPFDCPTDMFAFGSSKNMDIYADTFNFLPQMGLKGEYALGQHLANNNIAYDWADLKSSYIYSWTHNSISTYKGIPNYDNKQ